MHQRQQIREAVVQILLDANTNASTHIFKARDIPLKRQLLPAICVYTNTESVDPGSAQNGPKELKRTVQIMIDVVAVASEDVDDNLDDLAVQIERAMDADDMLDGSVSSSMLASTDTTQFEDGEGHYGLMRLTYTGIYYTTAPDSYDLILDDFTTAKTTFDLSGAQNEEEQALEEIELPQ